MFLSQNFPCQSLAGRLSDKKVHGFVTGTVHNGRLGKSTGSQEVLCLNHQFKWRQEHKSTLWSMLGNPSIFNFRSTASTFNLRFLNRITNTCYYILQCSNAISQLAKGRNKEEESSELQTLAAESLLKDYKRRAPGKLPLLIRTLKNMKLVSWWLAPFLSTTILRPGRL